MNSNLSYSPETLNSDQNGRILSRVTLKFDEWPWKTIGHLFYVASSFVHHSIAISEFKLDLQSGNAQFGSKSMFLSHVTFKSNRWPWKTNRSPPLHYIKLCTSFQSHGWIQTGVTVRKRSIWIKIGNSLFRVTLKFGGWPWKTIGHLFYVASSFIHHFIAIREFKLEL